MCGVVLAGDGLGATELLRLEKTSRIEFHLWLTPALSARPRH